MVRKTVSKLNGTCPCCGQDMPVTDFKLWPKSMAAFREGYVIKLGAVQFAVLEYLHRVYPNFVSSEQLFVRVYGDKDIVKHRTNLMANMHWLRDNLKLLRVSVVTVSQVGYRLHIDSWKEPKT